jgi:hypothetical protein
MKSSILCSNANEDCEELVFEQAAVKYWKTSEDQESDEEDKTERERVTRQDVRKCIVFTQEGTGRNPIHALEACQDFLLQTIKATRQATLNKFLHRDC